MLGSRGTEDRRCRDWEGSMVPNVMTAEPGLAGCNWEILNSSVELLESAGSNIRE